MSDPTLLVAHTVPSDVAAELREALVDDVSDLRTVATPDETATVTGL